MSQSDESSSESGEFTVKKLTEDEIEGFKFGFQFLDTDGDGKVSYIDILSIANRLNLSISEEKTTRVLKGMSSDKTSESLNWTDFIAYVQKRLSQIGLDKVIEETFRFFDIDHNGVIEYEDFHLALGVLLGSLFEGRIFRIFREADFDNDGTINFKEYERMMKLS